jgi:hypothetical protein
MFSPASRAGCAVSHYAPPILPAKLAIMAWNGEDPANLPSVRLAPTMVVLGETAGQRAQ